MKNEGKLTFCKKLKFSIADFEKYQELALENILKTIGYIVILILIFSLVVAGIYTYKITLSIASIREYIDKNIEIITFEDYKLNVIPKNYEKITKLQNEEDGILVIINTQEDAQNEIDEISGEENGILILQDKILIKNSIMNKPFEYSYKELAEQYNINKIDKQEALNLLEYSTIRPLVYMIFSILFVYFFVVVYLPTTLIDIIILSIFAYVISSITRMKLKYSALYNIAAYSLTLPIILNLLYVIVNGFTGFTIKYFEVMYTTVATIYIVAAILIIRSDVIKKQIELSKIMEEQVRVRNEIQRREEEQKEKEEKEKSKGDEDEKKEKSKDGNIGKEPEGDNA